MKKNFVFLSFTLVCAVTASRAQSPTPPAEQITVIRAGTLIDGSNASPRKNQLIFIRGNRIEKLTEATTQIPANATVIDLSSATVLPGLIDSHTHIFLWGEDPAKGGYDENILKAGIALRAARATFACRRALEQGFTTIRDLETEGAGYGDIEIKQAIEEGTIPGPRIFGATRAISTTGGYNLEGYAPELEMPKGAQLVDGPVEARKAARQQLEHGADWIKVYMTHRSWVDKQGNLVSQPTLTVDELKAIVDETHGGRKKLRAMRTTESDCSVRWMADAIPLSTDWKLRTRKSRKWPSKEPGIARRLLRITATGLPRIRREENATGRARRPMRLASRRR